MIKAKNVKRKNLSLNFLPMPDSSEQDDEPDFEQLNQDAVKSLHFLPEVVKTDEGFEVV